MESSATKHQHADTRAARMLNDAIDRMSAQRGVSLRQLASGMGFKSAVILSHMRSGRLPIPVDRAIQIANATEMDAATFLLAVLEQRHSDIDFAKFLGGADSVAQHTITPAERALLDDLANAAGKPVSSFTSEQLGVLREVAADPAPRKRWVGVNEAQIIAHMRAELPEIVRNGLTITDREKLKSAIRPRPLDEPDPAATMF